MKRLAYLWLALTLVACSNQLELAGEWSLVDPDSGVALGETLSIARDGTWSRNGTPSYEGTYSESEGTVKFTIEKYNGESREALISAAVEAGQPRAQAEDRLNSFEAEQRYEISSEDGAVYLKQIDPPSGDRQYIFKRQ